MVRLIKKLHNVAGCIILALVPVLPVVAPADMVSVVHCNSPFASWISAIFFFIGGIITAHLIFNVLYKKNN